MSENAKLWIISIPGPDDIYAAPSYEVAQLMKTHHDKCMTEWIASMLAKGEMLRICAEDMLAAIEECEDPEEHAELLTEFKYSDWGITEADLLIETEPEDASQAQLFEQEGEEK